MKYFLFVCTLFLVTSASLNAYTFSENKKACDERDAVGCYNLGQMYRAGTSVRQNDFKAKEFFGKACNGGYAEACHNLGVMYFRGDGVRQNDFKAKEFFGKACDNGDAGGCKKYALMNKK